MNNDRELLELAAKAIGGIELCFTDQGDWFFFSGADVPWHPIVDDGDAMRLAVDLDIFSHEMFNSYLHAAMRELQDRRAAYRLAIVEIAAEIGRAMP